MTALQKSDAQTGHTPGPWQSQHDFDLDGEFTIVGSVDGEAIDGHTHHTYTTVAEVYDNDNLAEDRANARLIAAAPGLLAALIQLIPSNVALGNDAWPDDTVIPVDVALGELRAARRAITKATTA